MDKILGPEKVFTTGEVASLFGVNINTVVSWFETGQLKGYRLPGSTARRVPRKDLIEFLLEHNMPLKETQSRPVEVLLVSPGPALARKFRTAVEEGFGYDLHTASCAFEAGMICAETAPAVVFVDVERADLEPAAFRRHAGRRPLLAFARLIAITPGGAKKPAAPPKGFNALLPLPASSNAILDAIDAAVQEIRRNSNFPL